VWIRLIICGKRDEKTIERFFARLGYAMDELVFIFAKRAFINTRFPTGSMINAKIDDLSHMSQELKDDNSDLVKIFINSIWTKMLSLKQSRKSYITVLTSHKWRQRTI
jgi:hypothetical protein